MWFIRILIIYCSKKALKYNQLKDLLMEQTKLDYIYAIGTMVVNRNKWLDRVKWLTKITKK